MKTKFAVFLVLFAAMGGSAFGQIGDVTNPIVSRPITVIDSGTCSTAGSNVIQQLPANASTTTVNLAGTFTATLTIRESNNGGQTWTTAGTATSAGTTSFSTSGFTHLCVDATAFTSGPVIVSISTGILQVQSVVTVQGTGGSNFAGGSIIDAKGGPYGLTANSTWIVDATFTAATGTVGSGSGDPCFVSATDVGKVSWGTTWNGASDSTYPSAVLTHAQGTITAVASCHSATVSTTPSSGTCTAACTFVWGTNDDTAVAAVWTAATGTPGLCKSIQWPNGGMIVLNPQFNTGTCGGTSPTGGGSSFPRLGMVSQGFSGHVGATIFLIAPNFNRAGCTAANDNWTAICFYAVRGVKITSQSFFGGGNPFSTLAVVNFFAPGIDSEVDDVMLAGMGSSSVNNGFVCTAIANIDVRWLITDGCGTSNGATLFANQLAGHVGLHQSFFGNSGGIPLQCNSTGNQHVESHGSGYELGAGVVNQPALFINNGCTFIATGDVFIGTPPSGTVCVEVVAGGYYDAQGVNCPWNTGSGTTGLWAHGGNARVASSVFGGANNAVLADNTTGQVCDETPGFSIYTGPLTATSPAWISGDCTVMKAVNLTAQAASIGATTLFTTPSTALFNTYTLDYDALVTTIGTGTLVVNLICNNGTATVTQAGAATVSMTANNEGSGRLSCHSTTSAAIQYSVTGFTTGAYSLNLRLKGQ